MISVQEAKKLINAHAVAGKAVLQSLSDAAGLALAENIYADYDIPAFPQSSMDGYAFASGSLGKYPRLKIIGESAAGNPTEQYLSEGEALRIFTGAPLPLGSDTVVMQEKTIVEDGYLIITDDKLITGMHMRKPGSEIKSGALALPAGTLLTPASLAFLAGIGKNTVAVIPPPKVQLIITGNELQQPGLPLSAGQVYESNSFSLSAALKQWGVQSVSVSAVHDQLELLSDEIKRVSSDTDIILLTGGVSVGDYDFVLEAARSTGIEKIFHRIKQKPGKPLYFGRKNETLVFGLPGNPASVLTCFYEYVAMAIEEFMNKPPLIKKINAHLKTSFNKPAGLTHFLKGFYDGDYVRLMDAQESYRMSSYATANCLIVAEEARIQYDEGESVEIHLLAL